MSSRPLRFSPNPARLGATLAVAVFILLIGSTPARAEVFQLLDNTQVAGRLLHYYEGVFHVELASGQKIELPLGKVKHITFKLPAARAEFSTPEKTFNRYKDALIKSDFQRVVDCYALMYQGMMGSQLGQASPDELKKMQKEVEGVKFEIKGSKITGQQATLKVQRTRGDDVETSDVRLVLENGEWKMTQ
jgi:hypothetical protein